MKCSSITAALYSNINHEMSNAEINKQVNFCLNSLPSSNISRKSVDKWIILFSLVNVELALNDQSLLPMY